MKQAKKTKQLQAVHRLFRADSSRKYITIFAGTCAGKTQFRQHWLMSHDNSDGVKYRRERP